MSEYLNVLMLTALPALGNFLDGALAELTQLSGKSLSLALHVAAGIVLAVVGIELMPETLESGPAWVMVLAFVAGGGFFMLTDAVVERVGGGEGQGGGAAWGIFFGVAVDLFSDGIMIGTGSTVSLALGLSLALARTPADIPKGFATIATFRAKRVSRPRRLLLSASFAVPILLGATVGYWGLRATPQAVKMGTLAFTAGTLIGVVVEEMVEEAHRDGESRWAALALVGGFGLCALITACFGEAA